MKSELIVQLTRNFEGHAYQIESGVEFARR